MVVLLAAATIDDLSETLLILVFFLSLPSRLIVGFGLGLIGGGGSIIAVPLLLYTVGMDDVHAAIGTSLVSVSTFGFTSASSYLGTGQLDLFIAAIFVAGGSVGGMVGARFSPWANNQLLARIFALLLIAVAFYVTWQGLV